MSDPETPAAPAAVKPFAAWLQEYRLRRPHEVLKRSLDQLEQRLSDQYAVLRGTPRS